MEYPHFKEAARAGGKEQWTKIWEDYKHSEDPSDERNKWETSSTYPF